MLFMSDKTMEFDLVNRSKEMTCSRSNVFMASFSYRYQKVPVINFFCSFPLPGYGVQVMS